MELKRKYLWIMVLSSLLISVFLDLPGFMMRFTRETFPEHFLPRFYLHFSLRFIAHFFIAMFLFQFNIKWKYFRLPGIGKLFSYWPITIIVNIFFAVGLSKLIFTIEHLHSFPGPRMMRIHSVNISTILLVVVVMLVSRLIELLIRNQQVAIENEQLKTENLQNQVTALKNQLDPHFLFNSLNTLSELIEDDKKLASGFVSKLSDVFRYLMAHNQANLISLKEEIDFVDKFVFLLKMRHASLDVEINLLDDGINWKIPPLAIQLLIENAVKHNEISKDRPLKILITQKNDTLEVQNNLQPKQQVETSEGMGLQNLRKRYRLISDKEIIIEKSVEQFTVKIPLLV